MSTTVTYKGSTLTTASDQTRVLKTAGKYLEDDITIVDVGLEDGDNLGYGVGQLTNLTGTSWYFNETLVDTPATMTNYSIDFTSNSTSFYVVSIQNTGGSDAVMAYEQTLTYFGSWQNQAYRSIAITGGTDATNADFITWLMANATQVS